MAYKTFPNSLTVESPQYLMFGCDAFMPKLFRLLLSKLRYMGDQKCKIHLDAFWEINMMAILNLKLEESNVLLWLERDQGKTEFKVEDMVLLNNHTPTDAFNTKYKPNFRICKRISDKVFGIQGIAVKIRWVCIQHLQLLYPMEHILTHLSHRTSFGQTMKYINHPNLLPNLHTSMNLRNECA